MGGMEFTWKMVSVLIWPLVVIALGIVFRRALLVLGRFVDNHRQLKAMTPDSRCRGRGRGRGIYRHQRLLKTPGTQTDPSTILLKGSPAVAFAYLVGVAVAPLRFQAASAWPAVARWRPLPPAWTTRRG
jgi:hypothetical protein